MPKNPHPPRNGASSKKAIPPAEDTSYIVFSNGKDDKKKGKKASDGSTNPANADKTTGSKDKTPEDAPKKSDVKTLIGGASWTGKLPVNMLSEHCQKQKWGKPEYTMHKRSEGFHAAVVLKTVNARTQETVTLSPMQVPPAYTKLSCQPTAVEARHFAAAYALFRVANGKNIHMMMPPTYRDLWKNEFRTIKREDTEKGNGYMYEADPFLAKAERDAAKAALEKSKEQAAKQRERDAAASATDMTPNRGSAAAASGSKSRKSKVEIVDMGKKLRLDVERLIRQRTIWNPHNLLPGVTEREHLVDQVANLGFRRTHVEEAAETCKDYNELLEWLLIHVPEDDLPDWSLPPGYTTGLIFASSNLHREAKLKRLSAAGYAPELCEEALKTCGDDERGAAAALQDALLGVANVENNIASLALRDDDASIWNEEQHVLASIFAEKLHLSTDLVELSLDVNTPQGEPITIRFRRPLRAYPENVPILFVLAKLPAHVRLSITKQALEYAQATFTGAQMIYDIVDWLNQEVPAIIERPGRLVEITPNSAAPTSGDANGDRLRSSQTKRRLPRALNKTPGSVASVRLLEQWQQRQATAPQQKMLTSRQSLPAWQLKDAIVSAVHAHQVVIISGETGSGKSTQSVQFILDDLIQRQLGESVNIICTQPRRISALALADRVADERCVAVGSEVGYTIRGEARSTAGTTKITFVTTGVLLRRLQTSGGKTEDVVAALADVSHVVVDEVHERSLDTDFLLVLLRDVLKQRKDLKVILMSATLDANVFEQYFAGTGKVGRIEIQGRTHPVQDIYLDEVLRATGFGGAFDENGINTEVDGARIRSIGYGINYDLVAETVRYIDQELGSQDGGILIFLPGTMEIDRTIQALRRITNLHALPLHASLTPAEQKRVFDKPPRGLRKVVAATNVAETSITIEDVVAVIDSGRVKETSFDPSNNMVKLEEVWASRAACKQRRGRAGRVRAGKCYKLYTRNAEASQMAERPDPEIRRVPLEQLCLSVRAMGIQDIHQFLAGALTPPDSIAVEGAVNLLQSMGALDGDDLTALGRHLSMIPADLRCGKLLVYGAMFGCLDACLTVAAILTVRSPFLSPKDKRDESKAARSKFGNGQGDLIADLHAYEEWSEMRKSNKVTSRDVRMWCDENFLSTQTLFDITSNRAQYLSSLKEIGFIPFSYSSTASSSGPSLTTNNSSIPLLRALIAASFYPQLARIELPDRRFEKGLAGTVQLDMEARTIKFFNRENGRVFIHPSSTLFDAQSFPNNASFMGYFTKMETSKVFIRDLTPFNAYTLLLFGGEIRIDTLHRELVVDGWARLKGWARIGVLVRRMRAMLDDVLARKIEDPGRSFEAGGDGEIVDVVRRLIQFNGMDQ